jgi:t-SNARE complex subunit (syntaxin)
MIEYKPEEDEIVCSKDEMDQIYRDVTEIKEITLELGRVIAIQNEQFDRVATNIDTTEIRMEKAGKELDKALSYQKSNVKRKIAVSAIGATAGAVLLTGVGGPVAIAIGVSKGIMALAGASIGGAFPHLF